MLKKLEMLSVESSEINKKHTGNNFFFTLFDNFLLNFFKCCMSRRMKNLNEHFKKLYDYSISYTDVLTIANKFSEIDKMKFVLLDQKQMAIFNIKAKLGDPLREKKNKMTELFIYDKDRLAQEKTLKEYIQSISDGYNPSAIDRKLINFCS